MRKRILSLGLITMLTLSLIPVASADAKVVSKPKLSTTKATLTKGKKLKLSLKKAPKLSKKKIKKVKWTTTNKKVATVKTSGKRTSGTVTAVGKGTCKIKVKYNGKTYTCKVTVKEKSSTYSDDKTTENKTTENKTTEKPNKTTENTTEKTTQNTTDNKKPEQPTPKPEEHVHTWDNGTVEKEATCTENGVKVYKCISCTETKSEVIEATGHIADLTFKGIKDATCTEKGYSGDICCKNCDEVMAKGRETEALGHTYSDKGYTCERCGFPKLDMADKVIDISKSAESGKVTLYAYEYRTGDMSPGEYYYKAYILAKDEDSVAKWSQSDTSGDYNDITKGCTYLGNGKYSNTFIDVKKIFDIYFLNKVKIETPKDMFNGWGKLENIQGLDNVSFMESSDFSGMFSGTNLTSIDLSSLDTSNANNMSDMFKYCDSLRSIDASMLDTSNVTSMRRMFANCDNLMYLDISNFNTSNVCDMSMMFCNDNKLREVNLSSFNTSKVSLMDSMFYECDNLTELDLRSFDTSACTTMKDMFRFCDNLDTIYVSSKFVIGADCKKDYMLYGSPVKKLTYVDVIE